MVYPGVAPAVLPYLQALPPTPDMNHPFRSAAESRLASMQHYAKLADQYRRHLLDSWTPREMSPYEIVDHNGQTRLIIRRIKAHEQAIVAGGGPQACPEHARAIFAARVEYNVYMARTFRVNDLPPEILSNIFRFVIWSADRPSNAFAWRVWLTAVCQQWRQALIADSPIWSTIRFDNSDFPHFARSLTSLQRAGVAETEIQIMDTPERQISLEVIRPIAFAVASKISTVRTLAVYIHDWDALIEFWHIVSLSVTADTPLVLQILEIYRTGPHTVERGTSLSPEVYNAPRTLLCGREVPSLKQVTFCAFPFDWATSLNPLKNLTVLDIRLMPFDLCPIDVLFVRMLQSSAPSLVRLILDGAACRSTGIFINPATCHPPVVLPSLRVLGLGSFNYNYASFILNIFSAPNLRSLSLLKLGGTEAEEHFFTKLVSMEMTGIEVLHLSEIQLCQPPRIAYPRFLASLARLKTIKFTAVSTDVLSPFCLEPTRLVHPHPRAPSKQPLICPELVNVEFQKAVDTNFVVAWLSRRRMLGFPIRDMYISSTAKPYYTSTDFINFETALADQGKLNFVKMFLDPRMIYEH